MRITEVGPRDGLQNEKQPVPTEVKLRFIDRLRLAGVSEIEATSFVSPKWVPQLADAAEIWPILPHGPKYSSLIPNERGLDRALAIGVDRIAVFTAASEEFVRRNINMTVAESLATFATVIHKFRNQVPTGWVRGYVSTIFQCPYAGRIDPHQVISVMRALDALGVDEICLGDTIGVGVPREVRQLIAAMDDEFSVDRIAWHFHDTNGTAIANVAETLGQGYTSFDSSAAGLGGCPYAPGAAGNLATEDLVYFLERNGIDTHVDLSMLANASLEILTAIGRVPTAKAQMAALSACATS